MDYPPFYKTRMGEEFYCKIVPDLVRQLERLNTVLEALIAQQAVQDAPEGEGVAVPYLKPCDSHPSGTARHPRGHQV